MVSKEVKSLTPGMIDSRTSQRKLLTLIKHPFTEVAIITVLIILMGGAYFQNDASAESLLSKGSQRPVAAYNPTADQYLVLWQDDRNVDRTSGANIMSAGVEIYGQLVGSDGTLIGSNIPITSAQTVDAQPSLEYNPETGGYIMVWQRFSNATGYDIYAQLLKDDGSPSGDAIVIDNSPKNQTLSGYHELIFNPITRSFIIAYHESSTVYGRLVDSRGMPLGERFPISFHTGADSPTAVYLENIGKYLITWAEPSGQHTNKNSGIRSGVYAQFVDVDGKLVGKNFAISSTAMVQGRISTGYNSKNQITLVVMPESKVENSSYESSLDITGFLMEKTAQPAKLTIFSGNGSQTEPSIASNLNTGEYLVVWDTFASGTDVPKIFGRVLFTDGTLSPTIEVSVLNQTQYAIRPFAVYNPFTNQYFVVWQDQRDIHASRYTIFGQIVSPDGKLIGGNMQISWSKYPSISISKCLGTQPSHPDIEILKISRCPPMVDTEIFHPNDVIHIKGSGFIPNHNVTIGVVGNAQSPFAEKVVPATIHGTFHTLVRIPDNIAYGQYSVSAESSILGVADPIQFYIVPYQLKEKLLLEKGTGNGHALRIGYTPFTPKINDTTTFIFTFMDSARVPLKNVTYEFSAESEDRSIFLHQVGNTTDGSGGFVLSFSNAGRYDVGGAIKSILGRETDVNFENLPIEVVPVKVVPEFPADNGMNLGLAGTFMAAVVVSMQLIKNYRKQQS